MHEWRRRMTMDWRLKLTWRRKNRMQTGSASKNWILHGHHDERPGRSLGGLAVKPVVKKMRMPWAGVGGEGIWRRGVGGK
jgi:hypothetical protein